MKIKLHLPEGETSISKDMKDDLSKGQWVQLQKVLYEILKDESGVFHMPGESGEVLMFSGWLLKQCIVEFIE